MGFTLDYTKNDAGAFTFSCDLGERDCPSPITYKDDGRALIAGEFFGITAEQLFVSGWENDPSVLNTSCSAICIVAFDAEGCCFASDNTGRELLYYYYSPQAFILSDDFWNIIKIIEPTFDDVDGNVVREMISTGCGVPADHSLPVKNMYWLRPNTIVNFSASTGELSVSQYEQIQRSGEIKDIDEAIESMDESMDYMAESLMALFPDAVFGLGLSGGLDSRVALHYLRKHDADIECFNICTARPHKALLAHSVKKSRALAKASDVSYKEVEWLPTSFCEKKDRLLREQPVGTGGHYTNLYKYEKEGLPKFDYLVTAGQGIGPYIVGVSAERDSDSMTRDDLIAWGLHLSHASAQPYPFTEHSLRKQLSKMGLSGIDIDKGRQYELWNKVVDQETYSRVRAKVAAFIDADLEKGMRPADITLDFRTSTLGAIGRNGAYESLLNSYRNFTIYTPFLVKEGLKWDIPLVEERRILKELIKRKIPEFASVGEEEVGSVGSGGKVKTLFNKAEFVIRGSGIMAEEWHRNDPIVRAAFKADFGNNCQWFYEIVPVARDYEGIWKMSAARKNSIWEMKRLIDCLERKDYQNF